MPRKLLRTETNTPEMGDRILFDALEVLENDKDPDYRRNLAVHFEHGQWWVTDLDSGAQWSVCDSTPGPFDYEQVTQGDDE